MVVAYFCPLQVTGQDLLSSTPVFKENTGILHYTRNSPAMRGHSYSIPLVITKTVRDHFAMSDIRFEQFDKETFSRHPPPPSFRLIFKQSQHCKLSPHLCADMKQICEAVLQWCEVVSQSCNAFRTVAKSCRSSAKAFAPLQSLVATLRGDFAMVRGGVAILQRRPAF